ncbi:phosphatase PAP2 family protein [Chungangia koreensis]|uniref:Phosphatase PAP2 family protein n=1 Tax=Chungangia koreensis TaxID=752657 RepID=A0ABV8X4M3_9LACT
MLKNILIISEAIAFFLFVILLFTYDSGLLERFDRAMSDLFSGNGFIEFFQHFATTRVIMLIGSILVIFFAYKQDYLKILFSAYAIFGGHYFNQILKYVVQRQRPDISGQYSTFSFPSGHAMVGILYIFTIAYFISSATASKAVKFIIWIIAIVFTTLVGLSRIAGERHFASDVVAGWALGFACFVFLVHWYRKGKSAE